MTTNIESFNAMRLRRVVNMLGLQSAVPASDKEMLGCLGTVLGMVARKIEERQRAPKVLFAFGTKPYKVIWTLDLNGDDPVDAAKRARAMQLDPDTPHTCFRVQEKETGQVEIIDLEDHPSGL